MRINVINYEIEYGENWIFSAISNRIMQGFIQLGYECLLTSHPVGGCKIYIHISYGQAVLIDGPVINIAYVTHIDTIDKLNRVLLLAQNNFICLCMSEDTAWRLNNYSTTQNFVSITSPALVGIDARETLKLMFAYRNYEDGRKNSDDFEFIIDYFSSRLSLELEIMGSGWESILEKVASKKNYVSVKYHSDFNSELYDQAIKNCEYLVYPGRDEGAISVLDALVKCKKVIMTAQGFHLRYSNHEDVYLYDSRNTLIDILDKIAKEKIRRNQMLYELSSWENYCSKIIKLSGY